MNMELFKWEHAEKCNWRYIEPKGSVIHIKVLETIKLGRISREDGELLCTNNKGKMLMGYDSIKGKIQVTCPKCIEIMNKNYPNLTNEDLIKEYS